MATDYSTHCYEKSLKVAVAVLEMVDTARIEHGVLAQSTLLPETKEDAARCVNDRLRDRINDAISDHADDMAETIIKWRASDEREIAREFA